jgi:hemin uptake protein HemP
MMSDSIDPPGSKADSSQKPENRRQVGVVDNRLDSADLFQATRELVITHGSETYRLRLTSQNKLILTK